MDREDRDRLAAFRRKLPGASEDAVALPTDGFVFDDAAGVQALVAAQGKLVAFFAMLLDRERIVKASELGDLLAAIARITSEENEAEGKILAIWAAGIQDVASGL